MRFLPKILLPVEIIAVLATLFGLFLRLQHLTGGAEILMLSLSALAVALFLRAYVPNSGSVRDDRPNGMLALLGGTIAPKVLMIGSAVTIIGCLFTLLHMKGAEEQMLIGLSSLGVAILLVVICVVTDQVNFDNLKGLLIRAVPVFLFGLYLAFNKPA